MGYIRKALEKGYSEHLGLHAIPTVCLIFLSFLDAARVALCLFLSTGSHHVCIQIHATGCCLPRCTTKAFGAQKGSLRGCRVGAGDSASCQAGKETSYNWFIATEIHARVGTSLRLSTP